MHKDSTPEEEERLVHLKVDSVVLEGNLTVVSNAKGIVLFAHGSGSSRHSPRNRYVAYALRRAGLNTLLIDLLTSEEEAVDDLTRQHRFDIDLLSRRLIGAVDWLTREESTRDLNIGIFGASTGAAAALVAAADRPDIVKAVVSRGGRPDLASGVLPGVKAPTLLIVGGLDDQVITMNEEALRLLDVEKQLVIVPGASHLFEEPGKLEEVARLASDWLAQHLARRSPVVIV